MHQLLSTINELDSAFRQDWPDDLELPEVTIAARAHLISLPDDAEAPVAFHLYTDVGAGVVLHVETDLPLVQP